jgi:protein-disulfide isomerase
MAKKRATAPRPGNSPGRPARTAARPAKAPARGTRSVVGRQLAKERARRRATLIAVVAAVLLLFAGIAGWYVYQAQRPEPSAAVPAGADAAGVKVGSGPATVDLYVDFLCPICKDFHTRADDTLQELVSAGKATLVYHPLAFLDDKSTTRYSTRSANASGCAADAGRFVEYGDVLFANQPPEGGPGLTDDKLIELAGQVGIDTGPFGACVRSEKYAAWVDGVTERGVQRGVTGTPTVYVNGRQVAADPDAIRAAVG